MERRIIALRFARRVLACFPMPSLRNIDQATGLPVRGPKSVRYEKDRPGQLGHMDIKKLGRIPDGGAHRVLGRVAGNRNNKKRGRGYAFLHHVIDDHSRLAYSEILTDENTTTVIEFWRRAVGFFAAAGIVFEALMTDNGSAYRSHPFAAELGPIKHRSTRPYRPQTNGNVERFNRTLAAEWAYAAPYDSGFTGRRGKRTHGPR